MYLYPYRSITMGSMKTCEAVAEAAKRIGISESQVRRLCGQMRIEGAKKIKGVWTIPSGTDPHGRMHMGRPPKWR